MADVVTEKREELLREAVQQHRGRVLSLIRSLLDDINEADDVFQDVLEEALDTFDVGGAIESMGAWLVTVARNKVLDRFRKRKTQADYRALIKATASEESGEKADDQLIREWLRNEIAEALENLPPEQRDVFVKHELEGKSYEEISQETGVGVNTLLSRKRYALLALRESLKEVYDDFE